MPKNRNNTQKDKIVRDVENKNTNIPEESDLESKKPETIPDPSSHTKDINSKLIFKNAQLTCQFLKDYSGIPIFKDLKPEDIEDVTEKYHAYLGVEFEADTVKKIRIQMDDKEQDVYVIPLIEHKSYVDYNIQMQILRYMSVIWYDYGIRKNTKAEMNLTSLKSFRYPPIIPIVYYEGKRNWTADTKLWERIDLGEKLKEYIPDFTYKVIQVHDYTNEEIQKNEDEISLVMMFNKIQSPEDYEDFLKSSKAFITAVLKDTPPELLKILQDVFWALLMKMNVPTEEAKELIDQMEAKNMGYLFENADKMDIQAERRKTAEAQKRADEMQKRFDEVQKRFDEEHKRADEAQRQIEKLKKQIASLKKQNNKGI